MYCNVFVCRVLSLHLMVVDYFPVTAHHQRVNTHHFVRQQHARNAVFRVTDTSFFVTLNILVCSGTLIACLAHLRQNGAAACRHAAHFSRAHIKRDRLDHFPHTSSTLPGTDSERGFEVRWIGHNLVLCSQKLQSNRVVTDPVHRVYRNHRVMCLITANPGDFLTFLRNLTYLHGPSKHLLK